jgi:hypothetical protein
VTIIVITSGLIEMYREVERFREEKTERDSETDRDRQYTDIGRRGEAELQGKEMSH